MTTTHRKARNAVSPRHGHPNGHEGQSLTAPIRFRCRYCRQLMGIARKCAGQVVDCSKCGRSLIVPSKDGIAKAAPDRKARSNDPDLATALGQLAAIGTAPDDDTSEDTESTGHVERVIETAPVNAPVPVPAAPQPVAEPIAPPEPVTSPVAPSPATNSSSDGEPGEKTDELETLRQLAATTPETPVEQSSPSPPPRQRKRRSGGLIPLCIAGAIVLALGVAHFVKSNRAGSSTTATDTTNSEAAEANPGNAAVVNGGGNTLRPPPGTFAAIHGRITWLSESGDVRPDTGARILLLPESDPATMLSTNGFLAGADKATQQQAKKQLNALGGRFAVADASGNYEIAECPAGSYHLLIISRFGARNEGVPLETPVRLLLEKWFSSGVPLIGRLASQYDRLRYRGSGSVPRDHQFRAL